MRGGERRTKTFRFVLSTLENVLVYKVCVLSFSCGTKSWKLLAKCTFASFKKCVFIHSMKYCIKWPRSENSSSWLKIDFCDNFRSLSRNFFLFSLVSENKSFQKFGALRKQSLNINEALKLRVDEQNWMSVVIESFSKLILHPKPPSWRKSVTEVNDKKKNKTTRKNLMKCLSFAVNVISFTFFLAFVSSSKLKFSRYYRSSVAKRKNKEKLRQKVFIALFIALMGKR